MLRGRRRLRGKGSEAHSVRASHEGCKEQIQIPLNTYILITEFEIGRKQAYAEVQGVLPSSDVSVLPLLPLLLGVLDGASA